jgi:STE24 endopeptidase
MNIYSVVILVALVANFVVELWANWLNLRSLNLSVPPELESLYKPDDYLKSQNYIRETTRISLIKSSLTLGLLLTFWFLGGFNYLDKLVRSLSFSEIPNGLLYVGSLLLVYSLLMLPINFYETFGIEQRFGFNKTTRRTFILDLAKGAVLAVVVGGFLLAGVLALFGNLGSLAWLYCWVAVVVFSLIMQYVAPNLIMPLFNKFKPLDQGELREAIEAYTRSVGFPVNNITVMDGSRRSSKSNAFFTGFGRNKRIALFDALIANHSVPELVAVLAHEVGHYKKKHIVQSTLISIIHTGLLFFILSLVIKSGGLFQAFYVDQQSVYTGLLFFGLLYTPIELVFSLLMNVLSRWHESEADRFAAETVADPKVMVEALKKLSKTNLSNLTPPPFYVFLNYSHPPLLARIREILKVSH